MNKNFYLKKLINNKNKIIMYESFTNINLLNYNTPIKNDLMICFVFFNTCNSNRLIMNYLYITNKLKLANIPYSTLEIVYNKPEIPEAIHIEGKDIMFQKERLCYVLEKHIPEKYTKLLFLDCDIIFQNPNWYEEISNALNSYNIIHPFENAIWLDITYKNILYRKHSVIKKEIYDINADDRFSTHTGFGWAFQRNWFNKIGFFQYSIVGGGDTSSYKGWLKIPINEKYIIDEYKKFLNFEKPSISYINGIVYHLYHGTLENRQYTDRSLILNDIANVKDILIIEENKPFQFKPEYKYLNDKIKQYLQNRNDDSM